MTKKRRKKQNNKNDINKALLKKKKARQKAILWTVIAALAVAAVITAAVLYSIYGEKSTEADTTDSEAETDDPSRAPDFTVFDENGKAVRLSDFRGKPVVLNFWATWCVYCLMEMPDFQIAYEKYPDVQFMMVNSTDGVRETVEIASNYVAENRYTFDAFYDTARDAVRAYGISSYPTTFFIDSDGRVVSYKSGMLDLESLEKRIAMITEGSITE